MSTFLFDKIIFGPVKSRRLGTSLGINLLPVNRKVCSFDCIYCECGLNEQGEGSSKLPSREEVQMLLNKKLQQMLYNGEQLDVITFAGNGEPTLHPDFKGIIDDTVALRNEYDPQTKIAVLSNAYHLNKESVRMALMKVDDNILKLDSGLVDTIRLMDRPNREYNLSKIVEYFKWFNGHFIIQTMFVKGKVGNKVVDNTREEDISAWLDILKTVKPLQVMVYTVERDTPFDTLQKVDLEVLNGIARRVENIGLKVQVSG